MQKNILLILVLISSLCAQDATQEQLSNIYQEAILFVAIFGVMGIISYIYSARHAKEYKPKEISKEKKVPFSRTQELYDMLENKSLTQEEFDILEVYYENKS